MPRFARSFRYALPVFFCLMLSRVAVVAQEQAQTSPASPPSDKGHGHSAPFLQGNFSWRVEPPFLQITQERLPASPSHPWIAIKDPSIVRFEDEWHLFCTLRKLKEGDGRIRIGYLRFRDWQEAQSKDWAVLELTENYHGAPQIFYFEPHQLWYLIYQAADDQRGIKYGPCYSVNRDLRNPQDWSLPKPLFQMPDGQKAGLDYWVICDDQKAHLFFTTLNGQMWRSETDLKGFPDSGWTKPVVALEADIFEASHTYKLKEISKYFTIVEAQGDGRRYFKGFIADDLSGPWRPLAANSDNPLVSPKNVVNQSESWATSYSHGEFLRVGYDQKLELASMGLRLLFQGANDAEYRSNPYGQIPWRLGLLELR